MSEKTIKYSGSNVQIATQSASVASDVVTYGTLTGKLSEMSPGGEPLGFVNRADSQISWNNTNKSLSLSVKSPATEYVFYEYGGVKYTKTTTQTATLSSPAAGKWYFYFASGTLSYSQSSPPATGFKTTFVAIVVLDASNNIISLGDERHGVVMDWMTHEWAHDTIGARWETGLSTARIATGTGGADGDAQVYVGGGTIFDEDIEIGITRSAAPTNDFEQELGVSGTPGKFPIYYRSGSGSDNWVKRTATNFPIFQNAGGERVVYNLNTGGTWSTQQISQNSNWGVVYLVGTNSITDPVIAVLGQAEYSNLSTATAATFGDLALGNLPFQEMKAIAKLIFKTSTSYANSVKCYVESITDLRNAQQLPNAGFLATDHNSLSGRDASACHPGTAVHADTTNFGGILTSSETDLQKVADRVDDYAQPKDATLTALAALSTSSGNLILCTGADTFSVGKCTDSYTDTLSQSKTHGSADTDTAPTALHHTLGTGANQAAAGTHDHSGTSSTTFQIDSGSSGPKLKNSSGTLQIRNAADSAYASLAAPLRPPAGTTTVAPMQLTSGTNVTSPSGGELEYDGSHLYGCIGATRYQLDQQGINIGSSQAVLEGTVAVYDSVRGLTGVSRIMPGDSYDIFWLPCDDYGVGGANQVRAIVNGFEKTITMTAGGVARQTFSGFFTRSMARASKTSLGLAFTLGTTEWSVSAWVHPFLNGSSTSSQTLLAFKDNNNNLHGISIITPSSSDYSRWYPQILIQGTAYGSWTYNTDCDAALPMNDWTHIGVTYDKTTTVWRIYRNGMLVANGTQSTTATAFNNGVDTINPGDVCAVCDMRVASIRRDESYYLETYQRGMSRFDRIPYRNVESWPNMDTESPTSIIWGTM